VAGLVLLLRSSSWGLSMSYFIIEYLEQRIAACDQMIANAPDTASRRIYEATRQRYVRDLEKVRREAGQAA
jgi:hypothetical protein